MSPDTAKRLVKLVEAALTYADTDDSEAAIRARWKLQVAAADMRIHDWQWLTAALRDQGLWPVEE